MKLQQMQENVGLQQVGQPQDQFKSQLEVIFYFLLAYYMCHEIF